MPQSSSRVISHDALIVVEKNHVKAGIFAGLIAGFAFGGIMGIMGMLPMVAGLVGSSSAIVGAVVNEVISVLIALGFAFIFGHAATHSKPKAIVLGVLYGFIWWILGPLLLMPSFMGMGPQLSLTAAQGAIPSLIGHLIFGFLLGLSYAMITRPGSGHIK